MIKKMCYGGCPKWFHSSIGLLLVRLAVGGTFAVHGIAKLLNMSQTVGFFGSIGFGPFWAYLVALVETLGGVAILLGVFLVPAGVLLAIVMLVAIFGVKWKMGYLGGYEYDVTLLATLLGLISLGSGKYAVGGKKCCSADSCNCGDKNDSSAMPSAPASGMSA